MGAMDVAGCEPQRGGPDWHVMADDLQTRSSTSARACTVSAVGVAGSGASSTFMCVLCSFDQLDGRGAEGDDLGTASSTGAPVQLLSPGSTDGPEENNTVFKPPLLLIFDSGSQKRSPIIWHDSDLVRSNMTRLLCRLSQIAYL